MFKKLLALMLALMTSLAFAVDANNADATQLDGVKGIGPALSTKIVEARKAGPFKDWNDLVNRVSGIGEKSAAKLSAAGLTVNGATFKDVPAAVVTPKAEKAVKVPTPATAPVPPTAPAPTAAPAPAPVKTPAVTPPAAPAKVDAAADKAADKAAKKAADKEAKAAAKKAAAEEKASAAAAKKAEAASAADAGKDAKKSKKKDKADKAAKDDAAKK